MSGQDTRMHCDAEALVGFVYDECTPDERRRVAGHLETCATCAEEVAGLRGAREHLAAWAPPEPALGFTITQAVATTPATVLPFAPERVAWWRRPTPVWAQAVAATVLFGLGLALGTRSGAPESARVAAERPVSVAPAAATTATAATAVTKTDLERVEAALRDEIARVRGGAVVTASAQPPQRGDEVMRQVRELLRDSEQRQQDAFSLRVAQVARAAEIQRAVDQANLQRSVMQIQGTTGEEVREHRELLNYLVNVSQRGGR